MKQYAEELYGTTYIMKDMHLTIENEEKQITIEMIKDCFDLLEENNPNEYIGLFYAENEKGESWEQGEFEELVNNDLDATYNGYDGFYDELEELLKVDKFVKLIIRYEVAEDYYTEEE